MSKKSNKKRPVNEITKDTNDCDEDLKNKN